MPAPQATSLPDPSSACTPQPGLLGLNVNYHAMLAHSPDSVVLVDLDSGCLADVNAAACALFGYPEAALLGKTLDALCPPRQPDGQASRAALDAIVAAVAQGSVRAYDMTFLDSGARTLLCEMRMVALPVPGRRLMHTRIVDITARTLADRLRLGQSHVLELVARGAPLQQILVDLVHLIESQSDGVLCSVLLLDEDGVSVRPAAAPSLPPAYTASLDGLAIGPEHGSCGSAMYACETIIVTDLVHDRRWSAYRHLALPFGLRACWSSPIFLDKHKVLGSFAMYYHEVRAPGAEELRLIGVASHLAGIAIERNRRERELAQHREHLEELVAARTAELRLANEELAATNDTLSMAQDELVRRGKLAALGALVAGIAHELNTPIGNSLMVATAMAEQQQQLGASMGEGLRRSQLDAYLARSDEASQILVRNLQRAATLIANFKQLAADHTGSRKRRFTVGELVDDLLPTMRIAAKGRPVTIRCSIAADLELDSYPGPLAEVLRGLFDNCLVHAYGDGRAGVIAISAEAGADNTVIISVADDGPGIAAEVAGRVYDPFYTTRLGAGRSGLGLHVVHNIVTGVLGGRIELYSEPGQGARFSLLLPVSAPARGDGASAHA